MKGKKEQNGTNGGLTKEEQALYESMAYRDKMRLDHITEEYSPPKVLQEYLTGGYCGYDKEGSPVRVELYGQLDMRGIMCSTRKSDLEKTKLYQNEKTIRAWEARTGDVEKPVYGMCVIFDMDHVTTKHMWRPGMQMYLHLVKLLEDNYPEMMKRMFVINGDYKEVLLRYIDADNLPGFLGGSLTDPDGDPKCKTMICHGGAVPQSMYLSEIDDTEGMEILSLPKGQRLKVDFVVEVPGSMLRWEFRSVDYDIGFGVVRLTEANKEIEIVPVKRVNAHHLTQDGSVICDVTGTYAVVFDNHYSWSRAKNIHYLIELHTSDDLTSSDMDTVSGSWTKLVQGKQITHL